MERGRNDWWVCGWKRATGKVGGGICGTWKNNYKDFVWKKQEAISSLCLAFSLLSLYKNTHNNWLLLNQSLEQIILSGKLHLKFGQIEIDYYRMAITHTRTNMLTHTPSALLYTYLTSVCIS